MKNRLAIAKQAKKLRQKCTIARKDCLTASTLSRHSCLGKQATLAQGSQNSMAAAHNFRQAAAIPIWSGRVCLVRSSSGRRWVVPKGRIERGDTAAETALKEAWEEAGLKGIVHEEPLGNYHYEKCGRLCHVTVFLMEVTQAATAWPESTWRSRRWFRPAQAMACIEEPGLRNLLQHATKQPASSRSGTRGLHRSTRHSIP